jgi:hypothetical protein
LLLVPAIGRIRLEDLEAMETTIETIANISSEAMHASEATSLITVKTHEGRELHRSLSVLETAKLAADLITDIHALESSAGFEISDPALRGQLDEAFKVIGYAFAGRR